MAMGQDPNHGPFEHPNPTTKIGSKMGGAPTPKWDPINGIDPQPHLPSLGSQDAYLGHRPSYV